MRTVSDKYMVVSDGWSKVWDETFLVLRGGLLSAGPLSLTLRTRDISRTRRGMMYRTAGTLNNVRSTHAKRRVKEVWSQAGIMRFWVDATTSAYLQTWRKNRCKHCGWAQNAGLCANNKRRVAQSQSRTIWPRAHFHAHGAILLR